MKASVTSAVTMAQGIDNIVLSLLKMALKQMSKAQLTLVLDQPNTFGNTLLYNASWTSDYITNLLVTEYNVSCQPINLFFSTPSFIFKNIAHLLLENGCNPFVVPNIKFIVMVTNAVI